MSLIVCTDPCIYQKDGCCQLSRAASSGEAGRSGCVNFVPLHQTRSLQQNGHSLPNVGYSDQL